MQRCSINTHAAAVAVTVAALAMPSVGGAVSTCRIRVERSTGVIHVGAAGISGALTWGDRAGGPYPNSFANAGTCIVAGAARSCELGAPGSLEAMTPPDRCTVYLKDSGAECAAYIKGCTPGVRATSDAKADALKELVAAVAFHHSVPTIVFSGVNVQIDSGSGTSDGPVNGSGNLIIGYNEDPGAARTGSHNLIIGPNHGYSSYGAIVSGESNRSLAAYGSAIGGEFNSAYGAGAVLVGGSGNIAEGRDSTITGGAQNGAGADYSSISGGTENVTGFGADYSSVSGGSSNLADAVSSSISGGQGNITEAGAEHSSISGGAGNVTQAERASISGGTGVTESTTYGWSAGSIGALQVGRFASH